MWIDKKTAKPSWGGFPSRKEKMEKMKSYEVQIFARSNSVWEANGEIFNVEVNAKSHKEAKELGLKAFREWDDLYAKVLRRSDIKVVSNIM